MSVLEMRKLGEVKRGLNRIQLVLIDRSSYVVLSEGGNESILELDGEEWNERKKRRENEVEPKLMIRGLGWIGETS